MSVEMNMNDQPNEPSVLEEMIQVYVSNSKMKAELTVQHIPQDGFFPLDQLKNFIYQKGIRYGVKEDVVAQIAEMPSRFYEIRVVIAEGLPPVHGNDSQVEWVFPQLNGGKPKELEDGAVDYYNIDNVINVVKGQLLAKKTPPTPGTPGMAVTGEVIEAKDGRNLPIKIGKNVVLDLEKLKAYAVIDGQVSITENDKINVFPIFEVKGDVDFRVGNIDFVGMVLIRGNVLSGFKIKATGDIRIMGEVEAADLEAGENIEIMAGVVAQGKGSIIAGRNVIANYINQANVYARNDVIVNQSIMHSRVQAGRRVVCTQTRGLIIGGHIQAGERIEVNLVGNTTNTSTTLEVGESPELVKEYHSIKEEIVQLQEELEKTKKGLLLLDRLMSQTGSLPSDKRMMRLKLMNTQMEGEKRMNELLDRKAELESSREMNEYARINIYKIAYPGTRMVFGKYTRHLRKEQSRSTFRLKEGEIMALPL